ncbi:hypothetical protein D3C75_1294420 [compost metagenome]
MAEPLGMQHQPFTFGRSGSQRAQVVAGRAEAAIDDQHIRMLAALAQDVHQRLQRVADGVASR